MEMEINVTKHHISVLLLVCLSVVGGCRPGLPADAPFKYVPASMKRGSLTGPFSGTVVDAGTDKPVEKALVYASWGYSEGVGATSPSGYREKLLFTDENGRFFIPDVGNLEDSLSREADIRGTALLIPGKRGSGSGRGRLTSFRLIVYKRGYIAYRSDRIFPTSEPRLDFAQHNNKILLERWSSGLSRRKHVRFIGAVDRLQNYAVWELQAAQAEMEGRVIEKEEEKTLALLDASELFELEDIGHVLEGDEDLYEEARLKTVPRTDKSDSKHFRAIDLPETHDLAYRVWRVPSAELEKRYRRLFSFYPDTRPVDQVGDRSFKASSEGISAHVFMDVKKGVLVSITCGEELCKDRKMLLEIAKTIHSRLDRLKTSAAAESSESHDEDHDLLRETKKPSFMPRLQQ